MIDADEWSDVFRLDAGEDPSDALLGYIENVKQSFSPNVDVRIGTQLRSVYMPWNQRFPHFADFVTQCTRVFRIQAWVRGSTMWLRGIVVHRAAFAASMHANGTFDGEVYAASVFANRFHLARLPGDVISHDEECALSSERWSALSRTQRRSVAWMLSVEKRIRSKSSHVAFDDRVPVCGTWSYDPALGTFTRSPSQGVTTLHQRGGIVADDCGSGKSATTLCLVCTTRDVGTDELPPRWNSLELLDTQATLLLVPPSLVQQWMIEVRKFAPHLRVLALTCSKELRASKMSEARDVDIVISTPAFLRSKPYVDSAEQSMHTAIIDSNAAVADRRIQRNTASCCIFARCLRNRDDYSPPVVFEALAWKRIVVDELGESIDSSEKIRLLCDGLSANFWWGLTATPNECSVDACARFALIDGSGRPVEHHPSISRLLYAEAIRGSRLEDADAPKVSRHVHPLHLDAAETKRLAESRCISKAREAHASVLGNYLPHDRIAFVGKANANSFLSSFSSSQFASSATDAACSSPETCPICFAQESDTIILPCAHGFCRSCVIGLDGRDITTCPVCRESFRTQSPFAFTVIDNRISTRSANVASLCKRIVENGERALLFCQFSDIARYLFEVISTTGLHVSSVEGSALQRASAIRDVEVNQVLILPLDETLYGMNLTAANHVVFPHTLTDACTAKMWKRAVSCCVRYGQTREVHVHTFYEACDDVGVYSER